MCAFNNIGQMLAKAHLLGYNYQINENGDSIDFSNTFGNFALRCFQGNYEIAESFSVWITNANRGNGLGQQQHLDRLEIARAAGLKALVATVDNENEPQIHILYKNGWTKLHPVSSHTHLWIKDL